MKRGHRPERTCLGCGARDDQKGLVRFVATGAGDLRIERVGKGRGGYLHKAERCCKGFLQKKKFYRAFRREITQMAKEELVRELRDQWRE